MLGKYLPIGSVVLLEGGQKRVMIIGRDERERDGAKQWDYLACLYPEGFLGEDFAYLFDHDQIARVFFVGFQDGEELAFQERLSETGAEQPAPES